MWEESANAQDIRSGLGPKDAQGPFRHAGFRPLWRSIGALISLGSRARLPVIAGTMAATVAANLLGDRNISSAVAFALCNAGEAVLVAALIERHFGASFSLDKPRNIFGLLAATIVGAAISGIGGTMGF